MQIYAKVAIQFEIIQVELLREGQVKWVYFLPVFLYFVLCGEQRTGANDCNSNYIEHTQALVKQLRLLLNSWGSC